ncbi:CYTH domain-containing protein [Plesiomonas shigelloides]|uniref:CYTH and CHAD domain-containing protein n=1 Tax=Plesiomonas shigelloides TaxID=703 RepID=UPI00387F2DC6
MNTEIELKFIVDPAMKPALYRLLQDWQTSEHRTRHLINTYYDTPAQNLRQARMGLRVRTIGEQHVQTLKTDGTVVAGLHQRPEFNVPLTAPRPELARFSEVGYDISWPTQWDLAAIQDSLQPLFNTDFEREQWLVTAADGSQIELAWDQGSITAGERQTAICEIELELVSGDANALFTLAQALCALGGVRQGQDSKAARGYRLAAGEPEPRCPRLPAFTLQRKMTLEQAFVQVLSGLLGHWQRAEADIARLDELGAVLAVRALQAMRDDLTFIRQWLTLFGRYIPRKASAGLRQEMQWLEEQLAGSARWLWLDQSVPEGRREQLQVQTGPFPLAHYQQLLLSPRYAALLLAFNHWLAFSAWQRFTDDAGQKALAAPVKRFADTQLGRHWSEMKSRLGGRHPLSVRQYLDQAPVVQRFNEVALAFAALYPQDEAQFFMAEVQRFGAQLASLQARETERRLLAVSMATVDEAETSPVWLANSVTALEQEQAELAATLEAARPTLLSAAGYWF